MGLEKAIEHVKEHRKPYHDSRRFDALCRNHGACGYCKGNRTHNLEKTAKLAEEDIELAKKANDFEEERGRELLEKWKADVHDIFRKMKEK